MGTLSFCFLVLFPLLAGTEHIHDMMLSSSVLALRHVTSRATRVSPQHEQLPDNAYIQHCCHCTFAFDWYSDILLLCHWNRYLFVVAIPTFVLVGEFNSVVARTHRWHLSALALLRDVLRLVLLARRRPLALQHQLHACRQRQTMVSRCFFFFFFFFFLPI